VSQLFKWKTSKVLRASKPPDCVARPQKCSGNSRLLGKRGVAEILIKIRRDVFLLMRKWLEPSEHPEFRFGSAAAPGKQLKEPHPPQAITQVYLVSMAQGRGI
jgi:hypothetical protein